MAKLLSAVPECSGLQFFIKSFKGKKYKAADSLEQFISTAVTQRAVPIPILLLPPVMLIRMFLTKNFFNFKYQLEGEAGSAEEQPASNKADAYTIVKRG